MAFSDLKFESTDFTNQDIASLPDRVTGQASMLKARFDNIGKNMLALGKFNDLCDALDAFITQTVGTSTDKVPSENAVTVALEGKADSEHTHAQSDVTGLDTALGGKANASHTHAQSDVTDLITTLGGKADTDHTHEQNDVTGLVTALSGKADSEHTHAQSDVTGLTDALSEKVSTGDITQTLGSSTTKIPSEKAVADAISNAGGGDMLKSVYDVSNKAQDIFAYADTKAPAIHTHTQSDVSGLETALNGKANSSHTHTQTDITGLDTALSDKADISHTHEQSDISGLGTALDGKANASHTHAPTDLTAAVPVSRGGTGATTVQGALSNLLALSKQATQATSASYDLDTCLDGVMYVTTSTTGGTELLTRLACTSAGAMVMQIFYGDSPATSSKRMQIAFAHQYPAIAIRTYSGTAWTAWQLVYTDKNTLYYSASTPGNSVSRLGAIWLKPIE